MEDLKAFLDGKYEQFNCDGFIADDPVQIPHRFTKKQDIEIAGFFAATLAWGNRKSIIRSCDRLMSIMNDSPYEFILQYEGEQSQELLDFKHRTFNAYDLDVFFQCLKRLYKEYEDMESMISSIRVEGKLGATISAFKHQFLGEWLGSRTQKHVSDPLKGSSAKRLCMFFRWMVRDDTKGVDFGLWKEFPTSELMMPLDVHTGTIGRKLGLLTRKQNDWKAVQELTGNLREMDSRDPVKYDFALFGLGAIEAFGKD